MQLLEQIQGLRFPCALPPTLLELEQRFDRPRVIDIATATRDALMASGLLHRVRPGESVAVTAGSRGIAQIDAILRAVVDTLKGAGAKPFVIAAMGSHGGATAEGQLAVLAELGVTPETMGVEVRATMEVGQIGELPDGPPLFQDVISAAADHTLLVNRVKPHTDFRGPLESGLAKMEVIGLGKQRGASAMHGYGAAGFARFLAPAARVFEARSNILGGLAILENAYDETAEILALTPAEIGGQREMDLQARAKSLLPALFVDEIDALIVRQIGKNVSGTGMDTNIIGRVMIPRQPLSFGGPDIAVIALLDLTPESHGNGSGIGLANIATARLAEKIDWVATYTNGITSGIFGMQRNALPITLPDDRAAIEAAVRCCGRPPEEARIVFVRDTLNLDRIWVSPNLRAVAEAHPRTSLLGSVALSFDDAGTMTSPWEMG